MKHEYLFTWHIKIAKHFYRYSSGFSKDVRNEYCSNNLCILHYSWQVSTERKTFLSRNTKRDFQMLHKDHHKSYIKPSIIFPVQYKNIRKYSSVLEWINFCLMQSRAKQRKLSLRIQIYLDNWKKILHLVIY